VSARKRVPPGAKKTAVSSGNSTRSAQDGHSAKPSARGPRTRARSWSRWGVALANAQVGKAPRGSLRATPPPESLGRDPGHAVAGPLPQKSENFLGGEALHRLFHDRRRLTKSKRISLGRFNKTWLTRFLNVVVALPAFVSSLICWMATALALASEIGEGLEFRDPRAKNLVADRELPGLVVDIDDDVFAEILSETSAPSPEPKFQTLFAHFSNSVSLSDAALEGDGFKFGRPGDLRLLLGSPPSRCLTHFGRLFKGADFADAGDVTSVPFDSELEVLVGIETRWIDAELGPWNSPFVRLRFGQRAAGF